MSKSHHLFNWQTFFGLFLTLLFVSSITLLLDPTLHHSLIKIIHYLSTGLTEVVPSTLATGRSQPAKLFKSSLFPLAGDLQSQFTYGLHGFQPKVANKT